MKNNVIKNMMICIIEFKRLNKIKNVIIYNIKYKKKVKQKVKYRI